MEGITELFNQLFDKTKDYTQTSIELLKLKLVEKTTSLFSSLVVILVVFICLILFIIPLNVGVALLLGNIFGKLWLGFLIVSGFYLILLLIILIFFRKSISRLISNFIIRILLDR